MKTFEKRNPADSRDLIGTFQCADLVDVDVAVQAARIGYAAWKKVPPPIRGAMLHKAAQIIEKRKIELAELITREMGKTLKEAAGEIASVIRMAHFCAGEGERLYGVTLPSALQNRHAHIRRVPVGVCALITPWNSPLASIAWKVFPAIICGNTCIVKPSEDSPKTAEVLVEILYEAGIPKDVVLLVHGIGIETGAALVAHPGVDRVSFTGSTEVGRDIARVCAQRTMPVMLEMGGKNGALVLADADLDHAATCIVNGAFSLAGQRCATTSRVIVEQTVYDALLEKIVEKTKKQVVGPGTNASTTVCPIVSKKQLERVSSYIELAKIEGAQLVLGGNVLHENIHAFGYFIEPTIFSLVTTEMRIAQEEVFGPVLSVLVCDGYEQGVQMMNSTSYGLTASIFTSNVDCAMRGIEDIHAGVVYVNAPTFGSEPNMPFGGVGDSGNGHREAGMGGIDFFSELKSVYIDYSGHAQSTLQK